MCITFLGYEWRHNTDRGFFALLKQHFDMRTVDPDMYRAETNGIEPRADVSLFQLTMHSTTFGTSSSSSDLTSAQ